MFIKVKTRMEVVRNMEVKTTKRLCEACAMIKRGVKFRKAPEHTCQMRAVTDSHQWVKDESFIPEKVLTGYKTTERHLCKVCGCERELTVGYRYRSYSYMRTGILFSMRPDCIDWNDRDALNKID